MPADFLIETLSEERLSRMMQCRLFPGLYLQSNVPVDSRARAISLELSSPIRDVHVASRNESEARERCRRTKDARCPCAVMMIEVDVASHPTKEEVYGLYEKANSQQV